MVFFALHLRPQKKNEPSQNCNKWNSTSWWLFIWASSGTCVWTSATPIAAATLSFTYPHILTHCLTSKYNSLLMIAWLASQLSNCLSLIHTFIPDEAQMNKWSSSFIREVSFRLIFVFEGLCCNILWFSKPDKDNRYIYIFFLKILFLIIPNMVNMHTGIPHEKINRCLTDIFKI